MLGFAGVLHYAPDARACGGTFCNGGPLAMPVEQTGENILFVLEPNRVQAHIQIQYQGDPERFAWILPVPALPESIQVGSQLLFQNLLTSTVPAFGATFCAVPINGGGGIPPAVVRDAGGVSQKR
jgi:hypothetical protein